MSQVTQVDGKVTSQIDDIGTQFEGRVGANAHPHVILTSEALQFGNGTAAPDTKLYRDGADILRTDNYFVAEGLATVGDFIRIANSKTPASATDTGEAGQICWDADYLYVCIANNTWRRFDNATW